MGQYYTALVQDKEKTKSYYPVDSAKLTEHSWINNPYVNQALRSLHEQPGKVIWAGDYAEKNEITKITSFDCSSLIKNATEIYTSYIQPQDQDFPSLENKYLVNHTRRLYMPMDKYMELSVDTDGCVLHPVPLLTAIGNSRGGGDYFGPNMDVIGSWAWDEIQFLDTIPAGYKEVLYLFLDNDGSSFLACLCQIDKKIARTIPTMVQEKDRENTTYLQELKCRCLNNMFLLELRPAMENIKKLQEKTEYCFKDNIIRAYINRLLPQKPLSYTKDMTISALSGYYCPKDITASAFAILQCKPESGRSFLPYDQINRNAVLDDYNLIKTYEIADTHKTKTKTEILEDLFQSFNLEKPEDFKGHSLSISDIIALRVHKAIEFYYVDITSFAYMKEETVNLQ